MSWVGDPPVRFRKLRGGPSFSYFRMKKLIKNDCLSFQDHSAIVCEACTSAYKNFQPWRWLGRSFSSHFSDFMGGGHPGTIKSGSNLSKIRGRIIDHAFFKISSSDFFFSNSVITFLPWKNTRSRGGPLLGLPHGRIAACANLTRDKFIPA